MRNFADRSTTTLTTTFVIITQLFAQYKSFNREL